MHPPRDLAGQTSAIAASPPGAIIHQQESKSRNVCAKALSGMNQMLRAIAIGTQC
jgi:hypothetical protein